ncbi:YdeI/OmpD-associated family protein [Candidatus Uhrbacteria bacterium]|nr:YdeI/OmpD-associated family protein [Candidatus Uhrbacteria bacterium]
MSSKLSSGTVHKLPADFKQAILSNPKVHALWEDITPLARNEWICWVTSGKKSETRQDRIKVGMSKMKSGERRPCCWIGCIHRTDKTISPSVKGMLNRKKNKSRL